MFAFIFESSHIASNIIIRSCSMLAFWGFCTIAVLLTLIMTKRMSVVVALVLVPIVFGLLAGLSSELGGYILDGLKSVAPTGIMLTFAILYFSVMNDAGMFDPMIKGIIKFGGQDPIKIAVGTALIAMLAHLDGSGASTFLVCIPAMIPIYDRLGMDRKVLACIAALGAGTMNIVPWGGPTLRASSSLGIDISELFNPIIPALGAGVLTVLAVSFWLGKKEKVRLTNAGTLGSGSSFVGIDDSEDEDKANLKRPKLFLFNLLLTVGALTALVTKSVPLPAVFVIALPIALLVNYPNVKLQQARITAHGHAAILMISIIFAAGVFTGILKGSGMIKALATSLVGIVPESLGAHFPLLTAITSMPASLLFDPDSYYFGVLPVLAHAAEALGASGIEVARGALLGQMTTGFPVSPLTASTFLLVGLAGVDLADHQKKTIPLAFLVTMVMTLVAVITGALSI
ncbi:MAG: citrate:proton symporter [Gammaproteobacteria bacterium]|nr:MULTISPECIES: citrate:proton symporter [unclassified Marinomonas]MBU1294216.1 citrate:proton symporter [Gammaproteobacteria bacterium]MBU1467243.1 citrate:proton symporter [Gammaproteobacteria bacterium]MBU2022362.1 citrate:proton symporter [Gammaproteobacteria bacterium]MBU2236884.1 citrate:proton symporter [Gammaproteobacteria bacterium]MBU2319091.1 citrate:proton symporter [Gammaproteobacteria bacterium]